MQLALRGGPYVEQVAHRGLPYDLAVVLPRYHRDGIGLLVVAAELAKILFHDTPTDTLMPSSATIRSLTSRAISAGRARGTGGCP